MRLSASGPTVKIGTLMKQIERIFTDLNMNIRLDWFKLVLSVSQFLLVTELVKTMHFSAFPFQVQKI